MACPKAARDEKVINKPFKEIMTDPPTNRSTWGRAHREVTITINENKWDGRRIMHQIEHTELHKC